MDRRGFLTAAALLPLSGAGAKNAFARMLGGTPTALVTADLESRLVAVDLSTGRISRHVRTIPGPRSIESVRQTTAVVAHTTEGAVSLVEGPSLRVRKVLTGFGEPRYAAVHPAGRYVYVTDSGRRAVAVLDVLQQAVVHRTPVGGPARHIAVDAAGQTIWTALGSDAAEVVALDLRDAARPRVSRRIRPAFLAHDVGFAPDRRTVWLTSGDSRAIALYDAISARPSIEVAAGAPPQHVTFWDDRAYVTSGDDGTLVVHGLNGRVLRRARVPTGSYNVQQAWDVVLTPSLQRGTLCVFSRSGTMRHRIDAARSSHDACFVVGP